MTDDLIKHLRRQNQILKCLLATLLLIATSSIVIAAKTKPIDVLKDFTEINVQRINIVSAAGRKTMVLSNAERFPDPVTDGKVTKRSGNVRPGIIFYNGIGDESGGLIFDGKLDKNGKPDAGMHFSMDRFGGDQQLAIGQYEENGFTESGLKIFDRGLHKDYAHFKEAYDQAKEGAEKDKLLKQWEEAGGKQTTRMFVGKTRGKSSALILADGKGLPRIMMTVTEKGEPKLVFLDEKGGVLQSFPENKVSAPEKD